MRITRLVLTLLLAMTASSAGGHAVAMSAPSADPLEERCESASTQAETLGCYSAAAAESHAEVERAFDKSVRDAKALDAQLAADTQARGIPRPFLAARLKASQAAWIKYTDSECQFEGRMTFGGSGDDILQAMCRHRLNLQRLSELKTAHELLNR